MEKIRCKYIGHNSVLCQHLADGHSVFCFWHDTQAIKNSPDIKMRLEHLLDEGHSLEGFSLHGAKLSGINLARANLMNAKLYRADLSNSSLLKANLEGANLNFTNLDNANLLGIRLDKARLEHTRWGDFLLQERLAKKATKKEDAKRLYEEAEEIARYLTNETEKRRQYDLSGRFYQLERVMRRMQMRPFSAEWCWSKLLDMLCGYGENTACVVRFSLLVILTAATGYFLFGLKGSEGLQVFNPELGFEENIFRFAECLYFSVITFTTTGYGDLTPVGFSRLIAAVEVFVGAFSISLFVVVFVRKMTQ
jgi:hypothetical protein